MEYRLVVWLRVVSQLKWLVQFMKEGLWFFIFIFHDHSALPGLFLDSSTGAHHLGFSVVPVKDRGLWNATQPDRADVRTERSTQRAGTARWNATQLDRADVRTERSTQRAGTARWNATQPDRADVRTERSTQRAGTARWNATQLDRAA